VNWIEKFLKRQMVLVKNHENDENVEECHEDNVEIVGPHQLIEYFVRMDMEHMEGARQK